VRGAELQVRTDVSQAYYGLSAAYEAIGIQENNQVAAAEQPGDTDDRGCRRLRDRLERLDDRMRAGYSGRESARLWQQRRELKEQIRRRRC
jgi:hypothetical protein